LEIRVARSAIETIRRATAQQPSGIDIHDQATGGILIGKHSGDQIEIVAATEPGPSPDNRQLGFALDLPHANLTLEHWFERDPDVDVVGSWHIHPSVIERPTIGDRDAAYALFDGDFGGNVYLSLIALGGRGVPAIRAFYLNREDVARRIDFASITYSEFDDTPAPPVTTGRRSAPRPVVPPPPEPARLAPPPPIESRRRWPAILLTALVVIALVAAAYYVFSMRANSGQTTPTGLSAVITANTPTTTNAATTESTTGAIEPAPSTLSTATAVASEAAVLPSEPALTATAPPAATEAVVATSPAVVTTEAAASAEASSPTPTADPAFPLTLHMAAMDSTATEAFLDRARKLDCEVCYNIDLIGPTPFQDLRIRLLGTNRPPLRNYEVPALALLPPRPAPYELQVFDTRGKQLSPALSFSIVEGSYYVLTIAPSQP